MIFVSQRVNKQVLVLFVLFSQCTQYVSAHYGFPYLIINGSASKRWEYVRPTTSFFPNYDYSGPHSVCGYNATKALFPVKTLQVQAGEEIVFGLATSTFRADTDESKLDTPYNNNLLGHSGPASAFLSKAPGELNDYEGDGDWFKIAAVGASDGMRWDHSAVNPRLLKFTIPKTTPPGKYLLRADHLYPWEIYKETQMYINCAHIEIIGPGGGTPSPLTKFPGAYNAKDPGIWLPSALMYPPYPMDELKNWEGAGGKVWKG